MLAAVVGGIFYSALSVLSTWARTHQREDGRVPLQAPQAWPAVVVLIPAKGFGPRSERFAERLAQQDYPLCRFLFALEQANDPAAALAAHPALFGKTQVVVAGSSRINSQKAHSLRAAIDQCQPRDEIVVLADADMEPPRDWLKRLVTPLAKGQADVVTGYRIAFPVEARFSSSAVAACDLALATAYRLGSRVLCWGGSTALRRETLQQLGYREALATTFSTDVPLCRLIWRAGLRVLAPADLVLPNEAAAGWAQVFSFARRQYKAVFTYSGLVGWQASGLLLPVMGWYAGFTALALGHAWAGPLLLTMLVSDSGKALLRHHFVRRVVGEETARRLRGSLVMTALMGWFLALLHLAFALSALVGRTTTWAGIRYRIFGPDKIERLTNPGA